jgi:hypothetical protein
MLDNSVRLFQGRVDPSEGVCLHRTTHDDADVRPNMERDSSGREVQYTTVIVVGTMQYFNEINRCT